MPNSKNYRQLLNKAKGSLSQLQKQQRQIELDLKESKKRIIYIENSRLELPSLKDSTVFKIPQETIR